SHGRIVAAVPRRGPYLQEDVIARAVRIGVGAVKMDVSRGRSVEAVRPGIAAPGGIALSGISRVGHVAPGPALSGRLVAKVDGSAEPGGVDLIDEGQLDDVAHAGTQDWTGNGIGAAGGQ